jgi:hypothetical protein
MLTGGVNTIRMGQPQVFIAVREGPRFLTSDGPKFRWENVEREYEYIPGMASTPTIALTGSSRMPLI